MTHRSACAALAILVVSLTAAPNAQAAARVFVSVTGTDAGDCSNASAPCRTLNFAIGAVDAGGEVIVMTTGSYAGATITKSVKLNAPAGIVAFSASPVVINAGANDVVVVRGLTLKSVTPGAADGIAFNSGAALFVENCVLDSWNNGIAVSQSPANDVAVHVSDTVVRNGVSDGVFLSNGNATGTIRAAIERSRFENNGNDGVDAFIGTQVTIRDSVATNNFRGFGAGTGVDNPSGVNMNIESCVVAGNVVGIFTSPNLIPVIARVSNSTITNNTLFGIEAQGGSSIVSRGNNTVEGNAAGETFTGTFTAK
jgi:hypothetical protein